MAAYLERLLISDQAVLPVNNSHVHRIQPASWPSDTVSLDS